MKSVIISCSKHANSSREIFLSHAIYIFSISQQKKSISVVLHLHIQKIQWFSCFWNNKSKLKNKCTIWGSCWQCAWVIARKFGTQQGFIWSIRKHWKKRRVATKRWVRWTKDKKVFHFEKLTNTENKCYDATVCLLKRIIYRAFTCSLNSNVRKAIILRLRRSLGFFQHLFSLNTSDFTEWRTVES